MSQESEFRIQNEKQKLSRERLPTPPTRATPLAVATASGRKGVLLGPFIPTSGFWMPEQLPVMNHWDHFWASRPAADDFYSQHERIERAIRDIGAWKGCWAVEAGSGTGSAGNFMLELGMKPILLDLSQHSLDKCRQRFHVDSGVSMIRGDVFRLPFKSGTLDLIFHQGLIEHFRNEQPRSILQENLRVLKPHGWLVVDVPQTFHIQSILSRPLIWMGKWFAGWQTYYTFPQLKQLVESLNLENIRYFGAWMNPSFFYRAIRWAFKSWFMLPLFPPASRTIGHWRHAIRHHLFYGPIVLWTGSDIGFVGRKPIRNQKETTAAGAAPSTQPPTQYGGSSSKSHGDDL